MAPIHVGSVSGSTARYSSHLPNKNQSSKLESSGFRSSIINVKKVLMIFLLFNDIIAQLEESN